jgi:methionyl-tRNA synthetase
VFPKYSDDDLAARFDVSAGGETAEEPEAGVADESREEPDMVSFDEFKRLDIRIARVLSAERVEKTDKLLTLRIDVGGEERQIIAGIAKHYTADELVGKTIVVVANLEPATIRGVESRGMLLAATGDDGLALLVPDSDLKPGAKVS